MFNYGNNQLNQQILHTNLCSILRVFGVIEN